MGQNCIKNEFDVKIKTLGHFEGLELPKYQTSGSAGMDLMAAVLEREIIPSFAKMMIPTGVSIEIPNDSMMAEVRSRSGLAIKYGVSVLNSPGTIDSDFRGEICVILINHSNNDFVINRGDRIAQLVFTPVLKVNWIPSEDLNSTGRGLGGFGSTD